MNPPSLAQIDAFHTTQQQSIALLQACLQQLHLNQTETEVLTWLEKHCQDFQLQGFIRRPVVHFDYRMSLRVGPSDKRTLQVGSVVQIHLQPFNAQAFGNTGISFVYQSGDIPIVNVAKELCVASCTFATHGKSAGEIFVFAKSWATNHRTHLNNESVGHFCFPNSETGIFGSLWPSSMRGLTQLRRYQLQWYNPRKLEGIYAIHPEIKQDNRRAGFAELIYVTASERIVLGRHSMDALCHFDFY